MRITKLNIIEGIICTLGSFGAAAVLLGGASCLIGLGAVGTIKLAKSLSPHRPTIQKLMFYGSATAGAGLFLVGCEVLIWGTICDRLCEEELQRVNSEIEAEYS